MAGDPPAALRYDERPDDTTPVHTEQLPDTPTRDRNIVATAWVEAPAELLALGDDLPGRPTATYKRRIGEWLLWRAGPAVDADARYWAGDGRPRHLGQRGRQSGMCCKERVRRDDPVGHDAVART